MSERTEYDVMVEGTRYAWANDFDTATGYAMGYVMDGEPLVVIRKKEPGKRWQAIVTYRQGQALAQAEAEG